MERASIIEVLRERALRQPDDQVYLYLADGENEGPSLTFAELDRRARAIGARLQKDGLSGQKALLLYPQGLDFIEAFLGCLYGGCIAVPAFSPHPALLKRTLPRLQAIIRDAEPALALTTSACLPMFEELFGQVPELKAIRWVATDRVEGSLAGLWRDPGARGEGLAFLQYTSGSTSTPKGVMVSHGNLMHNEKLLKSAFGHEERKTVIVSWLPAYHDMGLMAKILQAVHIGGRLILMSPLVFLQRPARWLRAISRYRANTSGAPNFAYELCVRKVAEDELEGLDLSSWQVAFNGAEPVLSETIERFSKAFKPCGFRKEAFFPTYGLAEATLIVAGGSTTAAPVSLTVSRAGLERGMAEERAAGGADAVTLMGCGRALEDQEILIVDPKSRVECPPGKIGEIWLSGPSMAQGYWKKPEETARIFQARTAVSGKGPYLRTGDLGFLKDGELFITGRYKDMMIIRGLNYYPEDIERTAQGAHAAVRPGCCAAFSIDIEGEERLVVAAELERPARKAKAAARPPDAAEALAAIRQAVAEQHELQAHKVLLVRTGNIPRTTSGKVRRRACRDLFLSGDLEILGEL